MSHQSSGAVDPPAATRERPESLDEEPIQLIDHTKTHDSSDDELGTSPVEVENRSSASPTKPAEPLSLKLTRSSLKDELTRRKWARYQEDRVTSRKYSDPTVDEAEGDAPPKPTEQEAAEASASWGESSLQRGRRKVREARDAALGKKTPIRHTQNPDAVIDVLYENQRGTFFCGIPLFSSRSLLNFDPPPWLDAHFKPSAVDITNAQVPDPSWSWDWRTWYVDMSHDVDEEGWEYSFWFQKGFSWHGTHPWFHSFVRRRRWLRKRTRKRQHLAQEKSHALNPDYFTIHTSKAKSTVSSLATSEKRTPSLPTNTSWVAKDWQGVEGTVDVQTIPNLMKNLRKAAIDREKVVYIKAFLDHAGDELAYLADQIPAIMALLIFQNSRRQLLSLLLDKFNDVTRQREEREANGTTEDTKLHQLIENLTNAVRAADEQCKRLEYWSDVRDVVEKGESLDATPFDHSWGREWAGIGGNKQDSDTVDSRNNGAKSPTTAEKGKWKAVGDSSERNPPIDSSWIDGTSEQQPKTNMEDILSDEDENPGRLSEDEHGDASNDEGHDRATASEITQQTAENTAAEQLGDTHGDEEKRAEDELD